MTTTPRIARIRAIAAAAAVAAWLVAAPPFADAEEFQVEVLRGSTVSLVSRDANGALREEVTREDPSPPAPEPEVEEPPEPPAPVVVVVKPDPPRPPEYGILVHPGFGPPKHRGSDHPLRPGHNRGTRHVFHSRRSGSVRGGSTVSSLRH